MIVVSTGCPSGVGPEVSVAGAFALPGERVLLVGDERTLRAAADRVRVPDGKLVRVDSPAAGIPKGRIGVLAAGPALSDADRRPGRPSKVAGAAQLEYIATAYRIARDLRVPLVSGPVSKEAIARSGAKGASTFRGHTEWLRDRDGAEHAVMCFAAPKLVTSLVTTHLPLARVPRALTPGAVSESSAELVRLLHALGKRRPIVAVTSLNPHAGEGELLGREESLAIVPGIRSAAAAVGRSARLVGPVGAETAYRLAYAGKYDGVVAMYHDQATIPMKLVAFGDAVNVTMGLSIVRTSVDHGTGYDIAWSGKADPTGMIAAMELAVRLDRSRRARR
jgi:4-hydroxythreonine-4-phosphate dehydrogenase